MTPEAAGFPAVIVDQEAQNNLLGHKQSKCFLSMVTCTALHCLLAGAGGGELLVLTTHDLDGASITSGKCAVLTGT